MPSLYSKIKKTLDSKKINYNELRHEAVFTSEEAAKIRGGNPEEGAKALIFSGKRSGQNEKIFLQLVIQGTKRVDKEKFKARFGFENLKMASSEDVEKVSGVKLNYKIVERRAGDVSQIFSDCELANKELGWKAKLGLDEMLSSSWKWENYINKTTK